MRIQQLQLKNFRIFSDLTLDLGHPIIIFEGPNGSGKTSLLEALHYLCYLRSFRTHTPRDLVSLGKSSFFIKIQLADAMGSTNDIQVGFSGKKRLVKVDQKAVQSFKELMVFYRVITLTEDDLTLIKGGPDVRRSFLDQALVLFDPEVSSQLRSLKSIVENRNALFIHTSPSKASLELWTKQLWEQSRIIQLKRVELLIKLEGQVNNLLSTYFSQNEDFTIQLEYLPKRMDLEESFEEFLGKFSDKFEEELRMRRSLFGAHLDDFSIIFCHKKSKVYSSRGQQKLIMVLLKIAQMRELVTHTSQAVFLLDDFMTDFDAETAKTILSLLASLKSQLIFTCPFEGGILEETLLGLGAHKIRLTH